ncbi:MAG: hypothetical protein HY071_00015 [Chloroflexi bacterium]|nr:hypothetical protein [Chloroflexota bacterium]
MAVSPNLGAHLVSLTDGAVALVGARQSRRWADDSELGFFELLGLHMGGVYPHPFLSIYPQVVDAQNLIQQVLGAAMRGHSVAFLDLVRARVVRPITTSRCVHEVDEKLPLRLAERELDPATIDQYWLPARARLRVVEVPPTIPYPVDLDRRGVSDRDLAQLAALLGIRAISWDKDLREHGLAEQFDLAVALAMGELVSGKCAAFMGLGLSAEATAALVRMARWLLDQAMRHPLPAILVVLGLAVVIARLRKNEQLVEWIASVEWRPLLTQVLEAAGKLMTAYHELSVRMPQTPRVTPSLPNEWNVSRLLANAAGPISAREIADQLRLHGVVLAEEAAREVLRTHPALFIRNRGGQWQLGTAAEPMVAVVAPASPLRFASQWSLDSSAAFE